MGRPESGPIIRRGRRVLARPVHASWRPFPHVHDGGRKRRSACPEPFPKRPARAARPAILGRRKGERVPSDAPVSGSHSEQAHISAEQPQAQEGPRFPHAYADAKRPRGAEPAKGEGPRAVGRLTRPRTPAMGGARAPTVSAARRDRTGVGTRGEVRRVLRSGARVVSDRLVVYAAPSDAPGVSFVSGRRVGGAVARNRARRVMREAWRSVANDAEGDYHVVVVARPEIVGAKTQDLLAEMRELLAAGGIVPR